MKLNQAISIIDALIKNLENAQTLDLKSIEEVKDKLYHILENIDNKEITRSIILGLNYLNEIEKDYKHDNIRN